MNRTITGGIALAGILATGAACTPEPDSGIVTELEYEKAWSMTTQDCRTTYTTNNKGITRSSTTCTPRTVYYPECWEVDYENEAEEATGEDCVSHDLFEALEVGDQYTKGMSPDDAEQED